MSLGDLVKHSVLGTAAFVLIERPLQARILASDLNENDKVRYMGIAMGTVGSGIVGYIIGDQLNKGKGGYGVREKLKCVAICGIAGGMAGYMIANGMIDKKNGGM